MKGEEGEERDQSLKMKQVLGRRYQQGSLAAAGKGSLSTMSPLSMSCGGAALCGFSPTVPIPLIPNTAIIKAVKVTEFSRCSIWTRNENRKDLPEAPNATHPQKLERRPVSRA